MRNKRPAWNSTKPLNPLYGSLSVRSITKGEQGANLGKLEAPLFRYALNYSSCKTVSGSTRVARSAGTRLAANDTNTITTVATV